MDGTLKSGILREQPILNDHFNCPTIRTICVHIKNQEINGEALTTMTEISSMYILNR